MATQLLFAILALTSLPAINIDDLPGRGWFRTEIHPGGMRMPCFAYECAGISGTTVTRETWETEGYEGTYETLRERCAHSIHKALEVALKEEWRPSREHVEENLVLVPSRLQGYKCGDRIYCMDKRDGRDILFSAQGGTFFAYIGIAVTLLPEELALLGEQDGLRRFQTFADEFIHSILTDDPYAPFRIEVTKEDGKIVLRGNHALPVDEELEDTDRRPIHYKSAIGGEIVGDRLSLVMSWGQFYYDWGERRFIVRPKGPSIHLPYQVFDKYVGKNTPIVIDDKACSINEENTREDTEQTADK